MTFTQWDSVDVVSTISMAYLEAAQVYAHPIDGFMLVSESTVSRRGGVF
jgi:hypothetical protein